MYTQTIKSDDKIWVYGGKLRVLAKILVFMYFNFADVFVEFKVHKAI